MTPTFTLRLLEEVKKSRGILKCANNRGESRRRKRIEWQRISEELNSQFGTAYTVMQIYKKVENVKGKVKQKLEAMKRLFFLFSNFGLVLLYLVFAAKTDCK